MKVMIVDDHALVRRGMGYVVKECFPDAEVHEAGGADERNIVQLHGRVGGRQRDSPSLRLLQAPVR